MRQQTVLRFFVSVKKAFSNAITFTVIHKYGEGDIVQIRTVFELICYIICRRIL